MSMLLGGTVALLLFPFAGHALEIQPPQGWVAPGRKPSSVIVQYLSPDAGPGFRANLVVTRGKLPCCREETTPPDSLISKVSDQQARALPLYKVLEKRVRTMGGQEGGFLISSYSRGSTDLACFQFFFLEEGEFVNVIFTSLLGDLPQWKAEFEKSLASLQPDKAKTRP